MTRDLDALVAIGTHVHVEQDAHGCRALDQELLDASAAYFKGKYFTGPARQGDQRAAA